MRDNNEREKPVWRQRGSVIGFGLFQRFDFGFVPPSTFGFKLRTRDPQIRALKTRKSSAFLCCEVEHER